MSKKTPENRPDSDKLNLRNIFTVGISAFVLAFILKKVMDKYKVKLTEPPEELQKQDKNQDEIIQKINELLQQGHSIVGVLFPHTSIADHVVFNRELQRFPGFSTAWIATKKFIKGEMGLAGLFAQAWLHIDTKTTMFWVTQAYLRDAMDQAQAEQARQENQQTMDEAVTFLSRGSVLLFFYPEGTRVKKSKETPNKSRIQLSRAHPSAFAVAEAAAIQSKTKIYLAPIHIGDVATGKITAFLPGKTTLTYGEPLEITQLRIDYEKLAGKIFFTKEATKYHHPRNPAKKRALNPDGTKQVSEDGTKLYSDQPADFGFADYVMWQFSKLMPQEKRGIYADECIRIIE